MPRSRLVVRREQGGLPQLRPFRHRGNYHPITAKIYTDLSYFTVDKQLCRDAAALFNYMTGYATPAQMEKLAIAPLNLRDTLLNLHRRRDRPRPGGPAGADLGQDEFAGRRPVDRQALPGIAGRSQDPARGPRHLLPPARGRGAVGEHPGPVDHRPVPGAFAHRLLSATASGCRTPGRRCSSPPPTGCTATWTGG